MRAAQEAPSQLRPLPPAAVPLGAGELPTLQQLGVPEPRRPKPSASGFGSLLPTLQQLVMPEPRRLKSLASGYGSSPRATCGNQRVLHGDLRGGTQRCATLP